MDPAPSRRVSGARIAAPPAACRLHPSIILLTSGPWQEDLPPLLRYLPAHLGSGSGPGLRPRLRHRGSQPVPLQETSISKAALLAAAEPWPPSSEGRLRPGADWRNTGFIFHDATMSPQRVRNQPPCFVKDTLGLYVPGLSLFISILSFPPEGQQPAYLMNAKEMT